MQFIDKKMSHSLQCSCHPLLREPSTCANAHDILTPQSQQLQQKRGRELQQLHPEHTGRSWVAEKECREGSEKGREPLICSTRMLLEEQQNSVVKGTSSVGGNWIIPATPSAMHPCSPARCDHAAIQHELYCRHDSRIEYKVLLDPPSQATTR